MTPNTPKSMKRTGLSGLILFAMLFLARPAAGQDFNYSVQIGTTSWSELSSQTLCNTVNIMWESAYRIPIGFSFVFNGISYDSVSIETNGYLVFDSNRNHAFTAYGTFGDKTDTLENHSVLGYELTGSSGNHVLKIQYKNVGQSNHTNELLSYQIWLHQNGTIDVITGENTFQPDPNDSLSVADTSQHIYTGLLNMNMQGTVRGYFVGSTLSGPGGQPVNDTTPDPVYFNTVPASGTRFTFSPAAN
jgi:hypothetical protein